LAAPPKERIAAQSVEVSGQFKGHRRHPHIHLSLWRQSQSQVARITCVQPPAHRANQLHLYISMVGSWWLITRRSDEASQSALNWLRISLESRPHSSALSSLVVRGFGAHRKKLGEGEYRFWGFLFYGSSFHPVAFHRLFLYYLKFSKMIIE
jgi:hypothetical protein